MASKFDDLETKDPIAHIKCVANSLFLSDTFYDEIFRIIINLGEKNVQL